MYEEKLLKINKDMLPAEGGQDEESLKCHREQIKITFEPHCEREERHKDLSPALRVLEKIM